MFKCDWSSDMCYPGPRRSADRKQKIVVRDLNQAGRSIRLDHRRVRTDHAVAIEVLVETGFGDLQRCPASRHDAGSGLEIAVAVGVPDGILVGPRHLPGNLVTAGRLLRADRIPRARVAPPVARTYQTQLSAR